MRQVFGWLGSCPETKRIYDSYDMVSHPLLQMSTSHIVVKHKKLLFVWEFIIIYYYHCIIRRCIFYAKNQSGLPEVQIFLKTWRISAENL